jgi:hypothetical protein
MLHKLLGPQCVYCYFTEVTTCAALFRSVVSIHYTNLIKLIEAIFNEVSILFFWGPSEGPVCLKMKCSY